MAQKEPVDNWFKKHEKELLEQAAKKREQSINAAKAEEGKQKLEELRKAHWRKCPKCGHDLRAMHMEDIEVDRCTLCQGVYFDRGEIESLLLRKTPQRFKFYRKFFGLD